MTEIRTALAETCATALLLRKPIEQERQQVGRSFKPDELLIFRIRMVRDSISRGNGKP